MINLNLKIRKKNYSGDFFKMLFFIIFTGFICIVSFSGLNAADQTITASNETGILGGIASVNSGDTLYLNSGIYNKQNKDYNIIINKSITIKGNGSSGTVIIDGSRNRIFTINNDFTVNFVNLTFRNSVASNHASAIFFNSNVSGNISIINSSFINNNGGRCGFIYFNGNILGDVNIISSNFTDNLGNIRFSYIKGNVNIVDSNFIRNKWGGGYTDNFGGGAIRFDNIGGNVTIKNSNFNNNAVNGNQREIGGAICFAGFINGSISINNSNFTNNFANSTSGNYWHNGAFNGGGGAISFIGTVFGDFNLNNSNFTNNTAGNVGGAILFQSNINSNVNIIDSHFINNTAGSAGGAILFNVFNSHLVNSNVNIIGSYFINNTGNGKIIEYFNGYYLTINENCGGAISFNGNINGNVSIRNSYFINNGLNEGMGGAIYFKVVNGNLSIISSDFYNNSVINDKNSSSDCSGGAIYIGIVNGNLNIVSSDFVNNSALNHGGALYMFNASSGDIEYNRFFNNKGITQVFISADNTISCNFNWWGHNTLRIFYGQARIIPFDHNDKVHADRYFVISISNIQISGDFGLVLGYLLKLNNDGGSNVVFDSSRLPLFKFSIMNNIINQNSNTNANNSNNNNNNSNKNILYEGDFRLNQLKIPLKDINSNPKYSFDFVFVSDNQSLPIKFSFNSDLTYLDSVVDVNEPVEIGGTLIDSYGNPIKGSKIKVIIEDDDEWSLTTSTDSDGFWSVVYPSSFVGKNIPINIYLFSDILGYELFDTASITVNNISINNNGSSDFNNGNNENSNNMDHENGGFGNGTGGNGTGDFGNGTGSFGDGNGTGSLDSQNNNSTTNGNSDNGNYLKNNHASAGLTMLSDNPSGSGEGSNSDGVSDSKIVEIFKEDKENDTNSDDVIVTFFVISFVLLILFIGAILNRKGVI